VLKGHLGMACFVQGLQSERIQTNVRSIGESVWLSQPVEISLGEEGANLSITEKFGAGGNTVVCTNYNSLGHMASRCVARERLPPANVRAVMSLMSYFKCGHAEHLARDCRQRANRESCGRGVARKCRQGTLDTRERGRYTEAACGVQRRNQSRPPRRRL